MWCLQDVGARASGKSGLFVHVWGHCTVPCTEPSVFLSKSWVVWGDSDVARRPKPRHIYHKNTSESLRAGLERFYNTGLPTNRHLTRMLTAFSSSSLLKQTCDVRIGYPISNTKVSGFKIVINTANISFYSTRYYIGAAVVTHLTYLKSNSRNHGPGRRTRPNTTHVIV